MVDEGEMSAKEAGKQKIKGNLMDAASLGIAALGVTHAVSDWKKVDDKRKESSSFQRECRDRAERRDQRRRTRSQSGSRTRWPYEVEDGVSDYGRGYGYATPPRRISY